KIFLHCQIIVCKQNNDGLFGGVVSHCRVVKTWWNGAVARRCLARVALAKTSLPFTAKRSRAEQQLSPTRAKSRDRPSLPGQDLVVTMWRGQGIGAGVHPQFHR